MDDQDLERLKGRLRHAEASYGMKHPILLSAKHPKVRRGLRMLTKVTIMKERSTFGAFCSTNTGLLDFETHSEM